MNRTLGHLCPHIDKTGPGEPPEDGEIYEMTLSSRHSIRNSSPGGLRQSTLPLGHETGNRTPNSSVKGSGANHYPRAPARRLSRLTCRVNFCVSRRVTRHVPNRADIRVGVFCT